MTDQDAPKGSYAEHMMDHEYDGIHEYDNPLPRWWVWTFWGTFVFSIAYFVYYHVTGAGTGVLAAYEQEMKAAGSGPRLVAVTEESLTKVMNDSAQLASGQAVFAARCMSCHGDKGQGVVGPNLTDNFWKNGSGSLMDIYEVAANGVPTAGMPAWAKQLSPTELAQVVAFVGSLRGKNEPGKPPEGKEVHAR
jgi:cytochrome c oxidase cbb3-type subunit 3